MAKGNRFGTFGGVFTPSVLTILGVIMYMRLPWIVGSGGLWQTLWIIFAAHVISVTTGLSVASIATDKKVRAGGPYYIISRSLGLPIGGTLGLALYVGLSFSVSLYVIGFTESVLGFFGLEPSIDAIRVWGSATLVGVTAVTLVSTAFAIKTQYLILTAIALSLVSIVAGSPGELAAASPGLHAFPESPSLPVLFGIFFPAVTGFTAGVNMSGDLADPKRAIPRGTLAAIGTGLAVYLGLALFLALRVDQAALVQNPRVLFDISLSPALVIAGIWGATLSSAIGSILGAPRILQAKSIDRLTPRVFAAGRGRTNEPRNALVLTFGIAEVGILIGELDVIAGIISMFFIMTYGFLNLSAAIESWVSPDFRPEFKVPRAVSVVGALTCLVIMVQLDFLAMIAATALLAGIFAHFKRRELSLESGDTWEGVWSSIVRTGLQRLHRGTAHQRNWRPNVILFTRRGEAARPALLALARSLLSGRGVVADFELVPQPEGARRVGPFRAGAAPAGDDAPPGHVGFFERPTPTRDAWETMEAVCRYHGFPGMEPNTVMLGWAQVERDPDRFADLLETVALADFNVLVYAGRGRGPEEGPRGRVDVWLDDGTEAMPLALALVRFMTLAPEWRRAPIRFLMHNPDATLAARRHERMRAVLEEARVDAAVRVLHGGPGEGGFAELVRRESSDADLVLAPIPRDPIRPGDAWLAHARALVEALDRALFVRPSLDFVDEADAREGRPASRPLAEPHAAEPCALPPLRVPEPADLADEARRFAAAHEAALARLHDACLAPVHAHHLALVDGVVATVTRQLAQLARGLEGATPRRRRKAVTRALSALLFQSQKLLDDFRATELPAQRKRLEGGLARLRDDLARLRLETPAVLHVVREPADVAPDPADPPYLRRLKRRHRWGARLRRRLPTFRVRPAALLPDALSRRTLAAVDKEVAALAAHAYQLALDLGQLVHAATTSLGALDQAPGDDAAPAAAPPAAEALLAQLQALRDATADRVARHERALLEASRAIAQGYADDLDRLDLARFARRQRRVPRKVARALEARLADAPARWHDAQRLLLERTSLELDIASLQRRLEAIVHRSKSAVRARLQRLLVARHEALRDTLCAFRDALVAGEATELRLADDFKDRFDDQQVVEELVRETQAATAELPEAFETLPADAVRLLAVEPFGEPEAVTVPLRRLLEFHIEAELVGSVQAELSRVRAAERRANRVAQDVVRLVSFHLSDLGWSGGEGDRDLEAQAAAVVETAVGRVEAEVEALRPLAKRVGDLLDARLEAVREATTTYALTGSTAALEKGVRRGEGVRVLSRVGRARRWLGERAERAVARLLYRRSTGSLLARRLGGEAPPARGLVDRVLAMVNAASPRPEVLDALPFYYRQLFLGKATMDQAFWVGREGELQEAARAVANHRRGYVGALVVTGERGSGTSALGQLVAGLHFDKRRVYQVNPPAGGSIDPEALRRALAEAVQVEGDTAEILRSLGPGSALVFHDVELWWERSPDGFAVIDLLLELVDRYGDRCFFILNAERHAFAAMSRFRPLAEHALAVVRCGALDAEALERVILQRHRSTGLRFELDGRPEEDLSDWRRARLFLRGFDQSRGNVGAALQAWVSSIEAVDGEVLRVRPPRTVDPEPLAGLAAVHVALLVQLVLHKRMAVARLARACDLPAARLREQLDTLVRMGLVVESRQQVLEINRFVHPALVDHLAARGALP